MIIRNINDKLGKDSRVPGLLVSVRGSDAVPDDDLDDGGGQALGQPGRQSLIAPWAASVNHKIVNLARGWGKFTPLFRDSQANILAFKFIYHWLLVSAVRHMLS